MPRDEFSRRDIERLRSRVAHRCSNPECRVPTAAPGSGVVGITIIGVAAHIHAASPGGPRFLKSMSPQERRSIENGIWLCASCATKVDRDEQRYPTKLLQAWKATAEECATNELGRKLPSNSDTIHQLTAALTGSPKNFIAAAISNTHTSTGIALEQIDPRFRVETTYQNGVTTFQLRPKEPIPFHFKLTPEAREHWRPQISGLIEHGLQATLSASGVELQGLPIVQEFFPGVDRIVLTPHGKAAVLKVSVGADTNHERFLLDDLSGKLVVGLRSFSFAGVGMGGLLGVSVHKDYVDMSKAADLTITIDLQHWVGVDVRFMPYLDKLSKLYSALVRGWPLDFCLESSGMPLLQGKMTVPANDPTWMAIESFLTYARHARTLAAYTNSHIACQLEFTHDEFIDLAEIADLIARDGEPLEQHLRSNCSGRLDAGPDDATLQLLNDCKDPCFIRFEESTQQSITVFGQTVDRPLIAAELAGVLPKVLDVSTDESGNRSILVEWLPADGFSCKVRLVER